MKKLKQLHFIALIASCLSILTFANAFSQVPDIQIDADNPDISNLDEAMQLTHAGDGSNRIFIAERAGLIKVFLPAEPTTAVEFLNMNSPSPRVGVEGEGGLLSITFHPNFESNGYLYTYFTDLAGDLVIGRYTASGNTAASNTFFEIMKIPHPINSNHNGGAIHFGPDGFLYASIGDGGGQNDVSNNGQNLNSLLGKILRIDVNVPGGVAQSYQIPADNPIAGSPVFASGLRNPFRWSFDRLTGDAWIGDVGQGAKEEINFRAAGTLGGSNFGWRCYEGDIPTPNIDRTGCLPASSYISPIYTYVTGIARGRSVIGGRVYRGTRSALMQGWYIGTDFFSGEIHKILQGQSYTGYEEGELAGTREIGEDEAGEIYAVKADAVYRIFADEPLPVTLTNFQGSKGNEGINLTWNTTMEERFRGFDVEFSRNAKTFETVGYVPAGNLANGTTYRFSHLTKNSGNLYYRLKMIDTDDSYEHSRIITVKTDDTTPVNVYARPTIISNNELNLMLDQPFQSVELVNASGQVFLKEEITGKSGAVSIPIHEAASGLYIVRLENENGVVHEKVLITD
ncbi:PQQ-dependent sugar dehydrogenase [Dyadobacter crusticola]|uniref:PQQ-dependent sugar dehydrogenase n=1 Tax=Dyadobacter crusticola TaxID=292407 RepID=UPI0004E0D676|nr:PQQ-dependent sugar dehydrogenase [Dyadobacter crusticola]